MLKVNVGLSRKLTRDFNSSGFTVNIEGEVGTSIHDAETALERIQEFYDLAEETLQRQIDRHESDVAIASRDESPAAAQANAVPPPLAPAPSEAPISSASRSTRSPSSNDPSQPATNNQVQFLLTLGKRQRLSKPQLENRIAEILGQPTGVYDLTKRDAGIVLDSLTGNGSARRR